MHHTPYTKVAEKTQHFSQTRDTLHDQLERQGQDCVFTQYKGELAVRTHQDYRPRLL